MNAQTKETNDIAEYNEWVKKMFEKHGSCSCGYTLKAPGVGFWTEEGWICKRCGELHTRYEYSDE